VLKEEEGRPSATEIDSINQIKWGCSRVERHIANLGIPRSMEMGEGENEKEKDGDGDGDGGEVEGRTLR
jgi:hypothetical protein